MKQVKAVMCALAVLCLASSVGAQDKPPAGMPPAPQPGPEHAVLKSDVGTWDATVEMIAPPGAVPPGAQAPPPSKAVETNTLLGGLWLVTDFKGDMMGSPFAGHGIAGWDPTKKKYVSVWTDTMSPGLLTGEATYDASKKTMTGWMEGPDMSGKVTKMTSIVEYKDPDTRVFTMSGVGPDGKSAPMMRITYKRRK